MIYKEKNSFSKANYWFLFIKIEKYIIFLFYGTHHCIKWKCSNYTNSIPSKVEFIWKRTLLLWKLSISCADPDWTLSKRFTSCCQRIFWGDFLLCFLFCYCFPMERTRSEKRAWRTGTFFVPKFSPWVAIKRIHAKIFSALYCRIFPKISSGLSIPSIVLRTLRAFIHFSAQMKYAFCEKKFHVFIKLKLVYAFETFYLCTLALSVMSSKL